MVRIPRKEWFELGDGLDDSFIKKLFTMSPGKTIYPRLEGDLSRDLSLTRERSTYSPFSFSKCNIDNGAILNSAFDEEYTCKVISDNKVIFQNRPSSLTNAARIVNKKVNGREWPSIRGPYYWKYDGKRLTELEETS